MDKIIKDIQNIKDNIYKIGNIDNERRKNILNDIKESIDKRRKEIIDGLGAFPGIYPLCDDLHI